MLLRRTLAVLLFSLSARLAVAGPQAPLVFLGDRDYAPLSYVENGEPKGLDVDVVKAVAKRMGRAVRIELLEWREAQARVLRGEADALTDLAISPARRVLYDFTDATSTHEFGLFMRRGDSAGRSLADFAGRKVGVTPGGFPRPILERQPGVEVVLIDNYDDGFGRLNDGQIDAMAGDIWTVTYALQRRDIKNVVFAGEPFATSLATIAVPKGHPALVAELNTAIRALHDDGTLQRIEESWRPQEMVFVSRQRIRRLFLEIVAIGLAIVLVLMTLWIVTLRRQVRERRRVTADLREREARLELALSAAGMGAWRWDYDTGLSTRDASMSRILGYEPVETVSGLDEILKLIVPEDRAAVQAELHRAIRERDMYATEYRIVRPDGMMRWLRGRGRAFYTAEGKPSHVTGTTIDITERREAEEALRISEEKFERAFQASPDTITISEIATGRFLDVNDRFEETTGYSRDEALGKTGAELGLVAPDERNRWMAKFKEAGVVRDYEYEFTRKDGRRGTVLMSAEMMELGGQQVLISVHRDVTERMRAQEALHRSESKYRELVENANDVVFTVDTAGYCSSMNRVGEALTGIVASDPRGRHITEIVAPDQVPFATRQLERVLKGEQVPIFELDIAGQHAARITLEVNVRPIYEHGVVVAAQGIARDVTHRRELEMQLRQAQKMDAIGRLAAGVAHDFNNLLTVILGNCEVAAPLLAPDHPVRNTLRDIRAAAERAAGLTRQLLAFSRRQIIQPRVLDVNDTIADIRRMMMRLIGEHIIVRFEADPQLWHVSVDPGQLQQVIVNLAVNARDAMPEGGRLTIATRNVQFIDTHVERGVHVPSGEYIEISVADTGTGMDADTLERLFEPFFTTKEAGKGTGLGLATVYGIVKQNGGYVFVDSAPSEGATFWILLPRANAPLTVPAPEVTRLKSRGGHETVLLVEDEDDVRELIHDYLETQGYKVVSAGTGEEGIALFTGLSETPALLISDIVMPGMNGRVLSDQLRVSFPGLKVLYVSGYTDDALVRHSPLPQGTHFLQKPFALSTLATRIRDIVDSEAGAK